jgi:AAHS family benzoate transporter-like MFS transporter
VGGPLLGGFLISGGFALNSIFYVLAGLAILGVILTLVVPMARGSASRRSDSMRPHHTPFPQQIPAIAPPAA